VITIPAPTPRRSESYTDFVKRFHASAKRGNVPGAYKGAGKNKTYQAANVMKKAALKWRQRPKAWRK